MSNFHSKLERKTFFLSQQISQSGKSAHHQVFCLFVCFPPVKIILCVKFQETSGNLSLLSYVSLLSILFSCLCFCLPLPPHKSVRWSHLNVQISVQIHLGNFIHLGGNFSLAICLLCPSIRYLTGVIIKLIPIYERLKALASKLLMCRRHRHTPGEFSWFLVLPQILLSSLGNIFDLCFLLS